MAVDENGTLVMLKEFVGSNVPDLQRVVRSRGRDAGSAAVKVHKRCWPRRRTIKGLI